MIICSTILLHKITILPFIIPESILRKNSFPPKNINYLKCRKDKLLGRTKSGEVY